MKKVIEACVDESLLGISLASSVKGLSRKKLIQDCLYYERKILRLLRRLQSVSEGVNDDIDISEELDRIKSHIKEIEDTI